MDNARPPGRGYGTTEQVSEYLGIPVRTLKHWRRTGEGPQARKFGRSVRYRWEDVDAWADTQKITGDDEADAEPEPCLA